MLFKDVMCVFIALEHLADVLIIVENRSPDFGKRKGSVYPQVLKLRGGDGQQPSDFM